MSFTDSETRGEQKRVFQVIIADDEEIERRVLARKLGKLLPGEMEIREAENGQQVLDLYGERPAQILILDIEMPGVSGLEAAERIRKKDQFCAIIFLTAFDEFQYAKRAIGVKATDYLLKPCDDRELVSAVEEAERMVQRGEQYRAHAEERAKDPEGSRKASEDKVQKEPGDAAENGADSSADSGYSAASGAEKQDGDGSLKSSQTETGIVRIKERVDAFVKANYAADISVSDVAERLGYTEAYFCRIFKQFSGQSFVSYLTEYRIREAKRLLSETGCSVREAGRKVGYPDANYFTRVFRRMTGKSPSEFRQEGES